MEARSLEERYAEARGELIERIRASGIEDLEILRLFDRVPRHLFVPQAVRPRAYEDVALPVGFGQTTSQPSLQAFYLQRLRPGPEDRVLEIGTGCGYFTALLAQLAGRIYSVERVRELSIRARKLLDELGVTNAALFVGDGTLGWRRFAPYTIIVVCAAAPEVPPALLEQLDDPGRMLIPVGTQEEQRLMLLRREGTRVTEEPISEGCRFALLVGRQGWHPEDGRACP